MDDVYIRALHPNDFLIFRAMRMKALEAHLENYCAPLETKLSYEDSDWQFTLNGDGKRVFGLFDGMTLIGITAIFTSGEDPSGQTGVLAMSYIEPEYRGKNYSALFYRARFLFASGHLPWTQLTVSHRRGNESSRRAILRHGFTLTGTRQTNWSDGTRDKEFLYILDLEALRTAV